MLAAGSTEVVRKAAALAGQMLSSIQGGTTSLVQTTDTDMSHSFKCGMNIAKEKERDVNKTIARMNGLPEYFSCGALEIMTIVAEAHEKQVQRNDDENCVLKANRRNGWLTWRPNLDTCKFELSGSQEWAKDMPEVSHRLPADWVRDRDKWLDTDGKPLRPNMELDMETADLVAAKAKAMVCDQDHYLLASASADLEFDRIPNNCKREMANMEEWMAPKGL
jgi:hypothetical protein